MEWWILLGLAAVALGIGVVSRIRKPRRREPEGDTNNIYPLW
jgi:hypothetical protein